MGDPEAVAGFLRAHPDFLAERPELYGALTPPRRWHGEALADHMAAIIAAERARTRALEAEVRAGATLISRVRLAVLALIGARDVADTIAQEFPVLLLVESCALLAEAPGGLPEGTVARLIGRGREARIRTDITDAALLHAEAAPLITRDALVRVPLGETPTLLALGARDAAALPTRQSGATLAFLGRAVAAALARG